MATEPETIEDIDLPKPIFLSEEEWRGIPETIEDIDIPKPHFYTQEEWEARMEREAQENFGMSVAEFFETWKAGKFDGKPELHTRIVRLAMKIPEAWDCDAW